MNKAEILMLFDYSAWANRRILDAAEGLSQEQFTAPAGLNYGSLRGTLVHILSAETTWRKRCQEGISPSSLPGRGRVPDAGGPARTLVGSRAGDACVPGGPD